jgi:hypothetical protein
MANMKSNIGSGLCRKVASASEDRFIKGLPVC